MLAGDSYLSAGPIPESNRSGRPSWPYAKSLATIGESQMRRYHQASPARDGSAEFEHAVQLLMMCWPNTRSWCLCVCVCVCVCVRALQCCAEWLSLLQPTGWPALEACQANNDCWSRINDTACRVHSGPLSQQQRRFQLKMNCM